MIRVLIADEMHMIRSALAALLSREQDIDIVAEVDHGDRVVGEARRTRSDVAVLDIGLPRLGGLAAAQELHGALPECRSLVLTGRFQPNHLLSALKLRVRGFLLKQAPAETLINGVRRVAAGERVVDTDLLSAALETGASPLTARETDVLRAADSGITTDQIAIQLALTTTTVRNYLSAAIRKVDARNRIDAIRIARNAGWI